MFDSDKKNSVAKPMLAFAFSVAWPYDSGANITSPAYCVHSKRFVSLHDCACAARFDLLLCGRHNTALNTLAYGEKYWFLQPLDEAYYSVLPTSILAEQEVRSTT